MKPICVPCQRFMRCKKSGYYFIEGKPWGDDVEHDGGVGKDSVGWTPYKVWCGDLWQCPDCLTQVISGVGHVPVSEHYLPDFDAVVARTGATRLMIRDC